MKKEGTIKRELSMIPFMYRGRAKRGKLNERQKGFLVGAWRALFWCTQKGWARTPTGMLVLELDEGNETTSGDHLFY